MEKLTYPIRGNKMEVSLQVEARLANHQSPFQHIEILQTEVFGKVLLLDGHIQLTSFDEAAYHECLVQIPMLNIPHAESALIVGGGDGGALRELVKNRSLQRIDMVEIDGDVIEICRKELPQLSSGAFEDPRLHLQIGDAFPFVKTKKAEYDLIIADSTDTYEGEDGVLSESLFTQEFYQDCLAALKPGGFLVTQADNPVICPYSVKAILGEFGKVFGRVGSYCGLVPSFGGYSAFVWGSPSGSFSSSLPKREPAMDLVYLNEATYSLAMSPLHFSG